MAKRGPENGFTLIELVIVMALLGVVSLVAIPQDYYSRFNLETATVKVANDIRYAQELANITNTNCGIQFVANGNYTLYTQSVATPTINPLTQQSFVTNLAQSFKTVNVTNNLQIEFNPLGRPVMGSGQSVQISNGTTTALLNITPNTGVILRQ